MHDKKIISVTSHALYPLPCHKLSHLLGPLPLERDVHYGRPLKDLPPLPKFQGWYEIFKVLAWRLEWDSNPRPSGPKAMIQPMCHHAPQILIGDYKKTIK